MKHPATDALAAQDARDHAAAGVSAPADVLDAIANESAESAEEVEAAPEPLVIEDDILRAEAPDAIEEDEPVSPTLRAMQEQIARMERALSESRGTLERMRGPAIAEADPDENPPKPFEQLVTAQDVVEYNRWERRQAEKQLRRQAVLDAEAASADQRARGMLNPTIMGAGGDYDSIISRYVQPLEHINPDIRRIFHSQEDPALARYAFGLVLEALEKAKNDPVLTFKNVRGALAARARGASDLVNKIREAEDAGRKNVRMRNKTNPAPSRGPVTKQTLARTNLKDFRALMAERDRRMGA